MAIELPDFDTLKHMAEQDPEALERLRQNMAEQVINSAPAAFQARLRGIQFQVDSQRRLAKNPMQSCIKISQMMHESFAELREKLNHFAKGSTLMDHLEESENETTSAEIIAFPNRL